MAEFIHPYEFINQEVLTVAHCWKIIRTDGVVMGFTSHDCTLTFDNVTYEAASGFTPSAIENSENLAVDNLDVQGILSSDSIKESDIEAGLYDFAEIFIYLVDWTNASGQKIILRRGTTGRLSYDKASFTTEIRGMAEAYQQKTNNVYQKTCRASLGDSKCKISLEGYTKTGQISTLISDIDMYSNLTDISGYFDYGFLTWTSGNNINTVSEVRRSLLLNGYIEFFMPPAFEMQVGDTFTIVAGCDRNYTTCIQRFNNKNNFRGEPLVPGTDYVTAYPVSGASNTVGEGTSSSRLNGWLGINF
jgi:uncharacterized phage protein (TIGR02218 family)